MAAPRKISKNPRVPRIIDCALTLLRDNGNSGLTMRQVAAGAGISLGNLQFYFKNKDELLQGMVDFYFAECAALFDEHVERTKEMLPEEQISSLVAYSLGQGGKSEEICRIFRELWAIAARNEEINRYLEAYYKEFAEKLTELLLPLTPHKEEVGKAVTLLITYSEGYGVTSAIVPLQKEQVQVMLTGLLMEMLGIAR